MKLKVIFSLLMLFLVLSVVPTLSFASEPAGDYDWLKPRLAATKAFTLEVLEAMPDDKYDYRANEDVRTFKEQAYHIAYSIDYYKRVFAGNPRAAWEPGKEDTKNKAELIAWTNEQFDEIEKVIMAASNDPRLTAGIIAFLDHNAHHRGQLIIYLRSSGIEPPAYK
ncbi:MAG: DinB family protein [Pyrinomonadaceae bacterium]